MRNFQDYAAAKYAGEEYRPVEEGIYEAANPYGEGKIFVTSLSFEPEPDCYGEEESSPQFISQVPFEDLLDRYYVFVSDFYEELNGASERVCYQEFGSEDLADIRRLREVIGRRFYAKPYMEDGEEYYQGVLE